MEFDVVDLAIQFPVSDLFGPKLKVAWSLRYYAPGRKSPPERPPWLPSWCDLFIVSGKGINSGTGSSHKRPAGRRVQKPRQRSSPATKSLDVPTWVPPIVAQEVLSIHASANDGKELDRVIRLATDGRMENVWREVYKKKSTSSQGSKKYFHPAKFWWNPKSMRLQAKDFRKKNEGYYDHLAKSLESKAAFLEKLPPPQYLGRNRTSLRSIYFITHFTTL
jgi:hypothetical protein